jgi:hypothetical protein
MRNSLNPQSNYSYHQTYLSGFSQAHRITIPQLVNPIQESRSVSVPQRIFNFDNSHQNFSNQIDSSMSGGVSNSNRVQSYHNHNQQELPFDNVYGGSSSLTRQLSSSSLGYSSVLSMQTPRANVSYNQPNSSSTNISYVSALAESLGKSNGIYKNW